ncbi:MAG: Phosphate propanoyltransferase [Eubacteriales bacterium SKADARSKE-1]|nr:Phosphate propanoyltransferase [Eubacteriales bacterium SKADARSKE-1]
MKILIEMSARHVHLSQKDLEILFGSGYSLTHKKDLSQPGQFASNEKVTIKGPKGEICGISVIGPIRKSTQVELSLTEARKLGITAPIRESGDINETPGCLLVGPFGEVELDKGVIAAKRHIHLDDKTAEKYGIKNKQVVSVKINSSERSLIFGNVIIRVSKNFVPAMHIDTDESNSAGLSGKAEGEIIV